jgi:sugar phosphate isomerase/epimerase
MKLAISNLAWDPGQDDAVAERMKAHGFSAVELAPTKYWQKPLDASEREVSALRSAWEKRGFPICALQSLLFNTEGLALFASAEARDAMRDYLRGIIRLGGALGARVLVFGSPKNRHKGELGEKQALAIAVPFFRELGEIAMAHGTCLCIEPNPKAYGCDFVTTSKEGLELVRAVNHPGFGLHLDAAGMTLSEEALPAAIAACEKQIRHFHASAPNLGPVGEDRLVDHRGAAAALRAQSYDRFVSIEMRPVDAGGDGDRRLPAITAALATVAEHYAH